jgi:putative Mg2+ transporter-C (MgtC) family protein
VDAASEVETTCRCRATTRDLSEARVRALLSQSIGGHRYQLRAPESADIEATDLVEVKAELATVGRNGQQIEAAAGRVGLEPSVTSLRWHVIERNGPRPPRSRCRGRWLRGDWQTPFP